VPETITVTVHDVDGVAAWSKHNATPTDQAKITAILETHGRNKQRQFADQPTVWEIEWFYRGAQKEFYRLALINSETQNELWGFS
jgi:hypothetical protein